MKKVALLTVMMVMGLAAPAQASFTSGASTSYDGYTNITESRAGYDVSYDCIHPLWAYPERECWYKGGLYIVECHGSTDYDYDNGTSTTTMNCIWEYAPGTVHSPLAASAGAELAASLTRGGYAYLPAKAGPPPPPEHTPNTGSDGNNC